MSDILEQINSLTEQFSNLFNEDYDTLDNASHIKRVHGNPEYIKDENGKYKRDENGFRVPANKAAKLFQKGHPKDGRTMYGDGYLGQGSGVVWTKRDNNLYDEDDNLKDSNKAVEKSIKRYENKVKKMNDNNSYNEVVSQINSLTEQFSNLFEVEGLGDPASDVPPSTNKIKKDRKTKDGKVELVSVEDELFPYDGNKREQYRQKIIDTINNMIQGTATLEDLLQIVRQKKMPVKEGFEGAIEILEEIINEVSMKKWVEVAKNSLPKRQEDAIKAEEKEFKNLDDDERIRKAVTGNIGKEARKASDRATHAELVSLIKTKGKSANKAIEAAKKVADKRRQEFRENSNAQNISRNMGREIKAGALAGADPVKSRANESFEGTIELLEEVINEVSDKTAQGALDKAKERYNRKGYEASMKLFQGDSKGAIEDGNKAQDEYNKHINMQLRRAKRQGKKLVQDKNDHDSFKIEEAQELLEEIINEVSLKKWKESAKNSYDKRKEVADKSAEADKKSWDNYEKQSKLSPEDEPELFKKVVDQGAIAYKDKKRADHAMGVYANTPDSKHSATKYNKAILNSLKGREDKYVETGKKSDLDRAINTFHLAKLNPVKEAQELSELFDRPDLLDDISKTLTNKTIKQHLENQVKKLLGGKKKIKKEK